jgi:Vacuolar protein sorting-associated protein 62
MSRALRLLAVCLLGLAVLAGSCARAQAASDSASQLALKYSPVVRLVAQQEPCGHGEPYQPDNVNLVLGNDEVALRGPWDSATIVKVAPTADDLSAGLFGYHLDFPGSALSPGCDYEQWAKRLEAGSPPVVYARVVGDPAHPGQVALQFWFFYVFNDYNDKHEGDWEMIQLDFAAPDATQALALTPAEVGYSQHSGAELAHWGDAKLELVDGTHPVVYPAAGSHANYYESDLYLGRSAAQGVGCDDTVGPSRELLPKVIVVPTGKAEYLAAFPWLGYEGRWGEKQAGFYNGPTGPNTKTQWTEPITWADTTWRETSYAVPAGDSVGTNVSGFFCGSVAAGSNLLTAFVDNPWPVLLTLAALGAVLLWLASRTRWDLGAPLRLRRRRPWGSLITSAWHMYRTRPGLFLGIGLIFVPLGVIITVVQYVVFRLAGLDALVDGVGASNAVVALLAFALGASFTLLGLAVAQAVTALAMVELDEERSIGPWRAYKLALRRLWPLAAALFRAALIVALVDLTVIGIPIGVWLTVRWSLLAQVVALEDETGFSCLHRSGRIVRGHWLRVASITFLVSGTGLLLGPVVGTLMLLLTSASFNVVNLAAGLIYAVTMPFVTIVTTYLYFDLVVGQALEPARPKRAAVLPAEA